MKQKSYDLVGNKLTVWIQHLHDVWRAQVREWVSVSERVSERERESE